MKLYTAILVANLAALAACSAPAPLPPIPAAVPAGLDLSGQWQLRDTSRATNRHISQDERRAAGADEALVPKSTNRKSASRRSDDDVQVHVFLEAGESLRITQTEHGLFISFDRAVVEEYRFGEQRIVNVGPIQAERVSGWKNDRYVIVTRDEEGALLTESYRLAGSDTLLRVIRLEHEGDVDLDVEQVFDRR